MVSMIIKANSWQATRHAVIQHRMTLSIYLGANSRHSCKSCVDLMEMSSHTLMSKLWGSTRTWCRSTTLASGRMAYGNAASRLSNRPWVAKCWRRPGMGVRCDSPVREQSSNCINIETVMNSQSVICFNNALNKNYLPFCRILQQIPP